MQMKWFGAVMIIAACGGFGFSIAASYRKQIATLTQIIILIRNLQSELHYKLSPLPDLVIHAAKDITGPIRQLMVDFASELERRVAPDVISCMRAALAKTKCESGMVRTILLELASVLGKYDFEGQLKGLAYISQLCTSKIEELRKNRNERIRCYQTLGMCAGAALVILFA